MFVIGVDFSEIEKLGKNIEKVTEQAAKMAVTQLTTAVHAHIIEEANSRLVSRREQFIKAVSIQQEGPDTFIISLDPKANWIEDGLEPHEMIEYLLGKGAKRAQDGSRYRTIPFPHGPGKGPTNSTPAQQSLTNTIKAAMKQLKIPFSKIEKQEEQPKVGLLHSFDVMTKPQKTHNWPGQGSGPIGAVRQGPTGIPFLQGVRVYQTAVKGEDGKVGYKKGIFTFRTVSSHHQGTGRWFHPGIPPADIFEEAHKWGKDHLEKEIMPKIVNYINHTIQQG